MRRVFLDASAMVPMADRRDQWRFRVNRHLQDLNGVAFTTSNWTLYEALALIQRRSKQLAFDFYGQLLQMADIISVPADVETEALRQFFRWRDKTASVVDHANGLVALETGCDGILTFDDDFIAIGKSSGLRIIS